MNNRFLGLQSVLIFVVAVLFSGCSTGSPSTAAPQATATYIPVITLAQGLLPTIDPTLVTQDVENLVSRYDIDLTCLPICWHQFEPGKTLMSDVFDLFTTIDKSDPGSTRGDSKLPLNSTGVGMMGDVTINAYSDDSQPDPKLRVYDLIISLPIDSPGVDPAADKWLPQNILKRSGKPTHISYAIDVPEHYYLLMSFNGWALLYSGLGTPTGNNQLEACPNKTLPGFVIWRYAPTESDALTVIRSLGTYPAIGGLPELYLPLPKSITTTTDSAQIDAIVNPLAAGQCVVLH